MPKSLHAAFRGLYEHTIDPKGRTSLPSRFREVLAQLAKTTPSGPEETLIVTTGIERCLVAYPPSEWRAFEAKLAALPSFDAAVVKLKRLYVAPATECAFDRHGRLLIPPMLRDYAELNRDVVWAGMVTTIEVWSKALWHEHVEKARGDRSGILSSLTEFGL